jgi:hypothetical protein
MKETTITEEQVRSEHMKEVNQAAHWAYALGVVAISFILMLALMAVLSG